MEHVITRVPGAKICMTNQGIKRIPLTNADDSGGHWVTTDDGNHLFITEGGEVKTGPGGKTIETKGGGSGGKGSEKGGGKSIKVGDYKSDSEGILSRSAKERKADVKTLRAKPLSELREMQTSIDSQKQQAFKNYEKARSGSPNAAGGSADHWEKVGSALDAMREDVDDAISYK